MPLARRRDEKHRLRDVADRPTRRPPLPENAPAPPTAPAPAARLGPFPDSGGSVLRRLRELAESGRHPAAVRRRAARLLARLQEDEADPTEAPETERLLARFLEQEVDGLRPRRRGRGRPPALSADDERRLLHFMLETPPPGRSRWTSRALAARSGLSQPTVVRFWQRYEIRPHEDPLIRVDAVVRAPRHAVVTGLFLAPPARVAVLAEPRNAADPPPARDAASFEGARARPRAVRSGPATHAGRPLLDAVEERLERRTTVDLPLLRGFVDAAASSREPPTALVLDGLSLAEAALVQRWAGEVQVLAAPSAAVWFELVDQYLAATFSRRSPLEGALRRRLELPETEAHPTAFVWPAPRPG